MIDDNDLLRIGISTVLIDHLLIACRRPLFYFFEGRLFTVEPRGAGLFRLLLEWTDSLLPGSIACRRDTCWAHLVIAILLV